MDAGVDAGSGFGSCFGTGFSTGFSTGSFGTGTDTRTGDRRRVERRHACAHTHGRPARARCSRQAGVAMVEMLLAAPVLCLLGLGALQVALLMHARDALDFAALEAARAGSVAHASPAAIEAGLARGLVPLLTELPADGERAMLDARAGDHVRRAIAAGELRWRQLSPTRESFDDWGEQAHDAEGNPVDGIEIPVDHLPTEARRRQPASGVAGMRAGALIGRASGQTLIDATLLRIEVVYGVPAVVPLAGALIARTLAVIDGCTGASARPMGAVELGTTARDAAAGTPRPAGAQPANCALYSTGDPAGTRAPRIPIRVSALVRMQSAVRPSATPAARMAVAAGRSLPMPAPADDSGTAQGGAGSAPSGSAGDPVADWGGDPGAGESSAGSSAGGLSAGTTADDRPPGFLRFGSDREILDVGACPVPSSTTSRTTGGSTSRSFGGGPLWLPSGAAGAS